MTGLLALCTHHCAVLDLGDKRWCRSRSVPPNVAQVQKRQILDKELCCRGCAPTAASRPQGRAPTLLEGLRPRRRHLGAVRAPRLAPEQYRCGWSSCCLIGAVEKEAGGTLFASWKGGSDRCLDRCGPGGLGDQPHGRRGKSAAGALSWRAHPLASTLPAVARATAGSLVRCEWLVGLIVCVLSGSTSGFCIRCSPVRDRSALISEVQPTLGRQCPRPLTTDGHSRVASS